MQTSEHDMVTLSEHVRYLYCPVNVKCLFVCCIRLVFQKYVVFLMGVLKWSKLKYKQVLSSRFLHIH